MKDIDVQYLKYAYHYNKISHKEFYLQYNELSIDEKKWVRNEFKLNKIFLEILK